MKHIIFAFVAATVLVGSGAAFSEERTTTIEVGGLWCASCPYIAAQALQAVESVEITDGFYDPDLQLAQFVISYDDILTNPEEIAAAPGEFGYDGKIIEKMTY